MNSVIFADPAKKLFDDCQDGRYICRVSQTNGRNGNASNTETTMQRKGAQVAVKSDQGRKVYVRPDTHKALKRYAADREISMFDIADGWIRDKLAQAGQPVAHAG